MQPEHKDIVMLHHFEGKISTLIISHSFAVIIFGKLPFLPHLCICEIFHIFISIGTPEYLLYSLGYDPVPHYFCPLFGAISYGIYVLWTYLHWSVSKTSLIWG